MTTSPSPRASRSGDRHTASQRPRIESVPHFDDSLSGLAVSLMDLAGRTLDDWQRYVLQGALGTVGGGRFSAFEVALNVPRQNPRTGKTSASRPGNFLGFSY